QVSQRAQRDQETGQPPAEVSMDQRADCSSRPAATAMAAPVGTAKPASLPVLSADKSAVLRDRLLVEIAALPSEDSAADWAQRALAAKNQLTAADARLLQVAFELRLSALLPSESSEPFVAGGSLDRTSLASDETISASAGPDDAGGHEPARIAKSAQ